MARPRKEINKDNFEKLCAIMCTESEICGFFGVTDKTLSRWCRDTYGLSFSEAYKRYSADGRISLRRAQFKIAERNATMAIFLGKNYLGQKDVMETNASTDDALVRFMKQINVQARRFESETD